MRRRARADQARSMLTKLREIQKAYQTDTFDVFVKADQIEHAYVKQFNGAERYSICRAHPLTPMIEADGKVFLCIDLGGRDEFQIGNIYDDPIDAIWASERRQQVISRIDLERKCPAGCFLDEANVLLAEMASPEPSLHTMLI